MMAGQQLHAQLYTERQNQHRFAQLHLGVDYRYQPQGGQLSWQGPEGMQTGAFQASAAPQLSLGGLHFWGRLDFLMHFELPIHGAFSPAAGTEVQLHNVGDLAVHYYPWPMRFGKIRPFAGGAVSGMRLQYKNGSGSRQDNFFSFHPEAGLAFAKSGWQCNLKAALLTQRRRSFHTSTSTAAQFELPPWMISLGLRRYFDVTLREEEGMESGRTYALEKELQEAGKLNSFSLGIGASTAIFLRAPGFSNIARQSLPRHQAAFNLDLGLGYLWHRQGLHLGVAYRDYSSNVAAYGLEHVLRRQSVALEGFKMFWNYNGFAPFLGLSLSYDRWGMGEFSNDQPVGEVARSAQWQPGLIFGWDILASPLETWVLRTNLRYYPFLEIRDIENNTSRVDQLEFNFIQAVFYPQRMYHIGNRHKRKR